MYLSFYLLFSHVPSFCLRTHCFCYVREGQATRKNQTKKKLFVKCSLKPVFYIVQKRVVEIINTSKILQHALDNLSTLVTTAEFFCYYTYTFTWVGRCFQIQEYNFSLCFWVTASPAHHEKSKASLPPRTSGEDFSCRSIQKTILLNYNKWILVLFK